MASIEEILDDEKNELKKNADEEDEDAGHDDDDEEEDKDGETEEDEDEVDDDNDHDHDDNDNDDEDDDNDDEVEEEDDGFLEWMKNKVSKIPIPLRRIWISSRWFKKKVVSAAWIISTTAIITLIPSILLIRADQTQLVQLKLMEDSSKSASANLVSGQHGAGLPGHRLRTGH